MKVMSYADYKMARHSPNLGFTELTGAEKGMEEWILIAVPIHPIAMLP